MIEFERNIELINKINVKNQKQAVFIASFISYVINGLFLYENKKNQSYYMKQLK
jgi:hypothetical protein